MELADAGKKAGEKGAVESGVAAARLLRVDAKLRGDVRELAPDLLPLGHAVVGEEVRLAELAALVLGEAIGLLAPPEPELEDGGEVGGRRLEFGVCLLGLLALLDGMAARVLA